jgi:hypothetical protein
VKDGPLELYDLDGDMSETTNLAATEPALAKKYGELLQQARTEPRSHAGASMKFREKWGEN